MQVEFFGIPRQRAGVDRLEIRAGTLGQLLASLKFQNPRFGDFIEGNRLNPAFTANLNGELFVSDPETPLAENDHLLILSADAGG